MKVLGVVAKTHDSGIALLEDGVPELIFEEERFNRDQEDQEISQAQSRRRPAPTSHLNIADVDAITTPWDVRQLRKDGLAIC